MKKVKLPENIHVTLVEFHKTRADVTMSAVIPSKWVKFEGQEKYSQFSWNKIYEKKINEKFGELAHTGHIYVLEFRAMQNMAMMLKRGRELNFDIIEYAKQFKDEDIKFTNAVYY